MDFISYTRNFEDVMLNRAFAGIPTGFYVDVGAYHPISDSNTYALYRRGWRGIALEPQGEYRKLWEQHRPLDILIGAAAGNTVGEGTFYELSGYEQNATTARDIAEMHRREGKQLKEKTIQMVTLDHVLGLYHPSGEIHCMSIDVEGAEKAVLEGLDRTRFRPWLILLESTLPNRPQTNFEEWESILLETGYEFAYFDAVNRFYLAKEHRELKQCFHFPPCVWDVFVDFRLIQAMEATSQAQNELTRLKNQLRQLAD